MSRLIIAGLLLTLAATGCNEHKQGGETAALHQKGARLKPIVTVVPVIDSTKNDLPWNLSDEFTASLDYRLARNNDLYIVEPAKARAALKKIKETQNPFGADTSWIKRTFTDEEFVVFLELVEHEEVLRQDKKKPIDPKYCSADLNISMRVRVFDLRGDQPKVVLQELVHDSHFVPRQFTHVNFHQALWGEDSFSISPMGLAHTEFTKEIATRVEEYILLTARQ